MGAFSEGMALSDKAGLSQADVLEVLGLGALASPMVAAKGPSILSREYPPAFPLKHQVTGGPGDQMTGGHDTSNAMEVIAPIGRRLVHLYL